MEENLLIEIAKILSGYREPVSIEVLALKTNTSILNITNCIEKLNESNFVSVMNDGKVILTEKARQPAEIPADVLVAITK